MSVTAPVVRNGLIPFDRFCASAPPTLMRTAPVFPCQPKTSPFQLAVQVTWKAPSSASTLRGFVYRPTTTAPVRVIEVDKMAGNFMTFLSARWEEKHKCVRSSQKTFSSDGRVGRH